MIDSRCVRQWASVLLVAFALSYTADGEQALAALSGRVVDEGGGPLPAATVTVHKLSGEQFEESSTTDAQGRYSFPELPDGEYSVDGALPGFVSNSYKPVRIYFPAQVRWDFQLRLGGFGHDAVYSSSELVGELTSHRARVAGARICVTRVGQADRSICAVTNRLGQYFLDVPPAIYLVTVETGAVALSNQRLDLSVAGSYRNKIALPEAPP